MRVIEASELIAADLFSAFEQARQRITFSDVQRHLALIGLPPPRLWLWPPWAGVAGNGAACLRHRLGVAAAGAGTKVRGRLGEAGSNSNL